MRVEKYSHLPLIKSSIFDKKKKSGGFGYAKTKRDVNEFYKAEIKKLDFIGDTYKKDKETYHNYFDPNLIFKIKLTNGHSPYDESFRNELKRAGIETIASAPDKQGYWVAFTDDADFSKFRLKLKTRISKDKATFVDMIDGIEEIPPEEKLDKSLREKPLVKDKSEYLTVEIWKMEDNQLQKFMHGLSSLIKDNHGEICDTLAIDSFCILRIKCDSLLLAKLIKLREVSHVERLPQISPRVKLDADIETFDVHGSPDEDKPGILIVDSGINNHPLLEYAIASKNVFPSFDGKIRKDVDIDDVGHGTMVAGIALYGDVGKCIQDKKFDPQVWLHSAKVMYMGDYGNAVFHEKSLLEHQLKDAIEQTVKEHPRCKIVNISLGDSNRKMWPGQRQFRIASLIDELAFQYCDILFTIAAGNNQDDVSEYETYPNYLIDDDARVKIIDPATSIHGITVGSIFPFGAANSDYPSPFTRVGLGLQRAIKPELVDYGGGFDQDLTTINSRWLEEGRLFTLDRGTSLSAPKIAHFLAKLKDAFPDASRNFLKALLLSSAVVPSDLPSPLNEINVCKNDDLQKILSIFGYGKPDLTRALYSESNRVLLTHDGKIRLNCVELFEINLPKEFFTENGRRIIEITLVFDPPTNRNRANYLGVTMEYHLFKNSSVENVRRTYEEIKIDEKNESIVPEQLHNREIKMLPGVNLRKKGAHQKSIKKYCKKPKIIFDEPLVLAVICQKKWFDQNKYQQPYSVIVTFTHEHEIDLYNMIRLKNKARARVR